MDSLVQAPAERSVFADRSAAGQVLAGMLKSYAGRPDVLVLALPRGGVPVGYEIACVLGVPLDVFLVRKLGVIGHEELAMGAIATGGVTVLNQDIVSAWNIPPADIERVVRMESEELARREKAYRGDRPFPDPRGKVVILVDDGLATGATMRAAARALRQLGPLRLVVAVPVGSPDICRSFHREADEVVCAHTPDPFYAVGLWYDDFTPTTDQDVQDLLARAAER